MVELRALSAASFIILLLGFTALIILTTHSAAIEVGGGAVVEEGNHVRVRELHGKWQRKLWMNHGSFRGPRKQLVNPTVQHPFQAREFPV
ncbi:hypothetical protein I3843_12G069200 [Carya illinoinensis]|uniref:Uncharacterized protein n=1 Tax=Carya illinoinensis TaxID=32201 RepID=A0A922IWN1_CARIL|nr:hypothetical protein I3760_12G067300 [Carya illinoinensis]KAG6684548.1 hypothetical protein I3842_12G068100 [Carya illinoinensis]KAG7952645.1 hypothetical protein I3843_12G069200 [Carya illinoinensis]